MPIVMQVTIAVPTESQDLPLHPFPVLGRPSRFGLRVGWAVVAVISVIPAAGRLGPPHGVDVVLWAFISVWVAFAILGFVTVGRRRFEITDEGVEFVGIFRHIRADWSEVEWIGWFTDLGNAYRPTTQYLLVVQVRGHRVPCFDLAVEATRFAEQNNASVTSIKHQIKLAVEDRNVPYRERIPDMSETRFWAWQMAIFALVVILLPITIVKLTR